MQIVTINPDNTISAPFEWDGVSPLTLGDGVAIRDVTGLTIPAGAVYDPHTQTIAVPAPPAAPPSASAPSKL
jgi:hypothetical protein